MTVRGFAWGLVLLGLVLAIFGWKAWNPVAFVGAVLVILGLVVRWTSPASRQ